MNGTIKRLVSDKGFGFVKLEGGKDAPEYFFHKSGCQDFDSLREGQKVSFDQEDSQKGPRATNVEAN